MIKNTLTIILLFSLSLFANNTKNNIDLINSDIQVLDKNLNAMPNKTKEDYEKKQNLLTPVEGKESSLIKKEDDITIDSNVDFNKSAKTIDGVKLNLGTKF